MEKIETFRSLVESNHTCVYWESSEELKSKVIVGLTTTVKKFPTVGWVRANNVPSESSLKDILDLRKQVASLEAELETSRTSAPAGTEDLMQGDDLYTLKVSFMPNYLADHNGNLVQHIQLIYLHLGMIYFLQYPQC